MQKNPPNIVFARGWRVEISKNSILLQIKKIINKTQDPRLSTKCLGSDTSVFQRRAEEQATDIHLKFENEKHAEEMDRFDSESKILLQQNNKERKINMKNKFK